MEKTTLRATMRARRRSVAPDEARRGGERAAALLEGFYASAPGGGPKTALLYASLPGEVDTAPIDALLRGHGADVAYPRVDGPTLRLHRAAPDELEQGRFAIREPSIESPEIPSAALDLVIVPGLAFDRDGHRLGFGRGYYDALLEQAPEALRVGVCLPGELILHVPSEPHDRRMDLVIAGELHATLARPRPSPPSPPSEKEVAP